MQKTAEDGSALNPAERTEPSAPALVTGFETPKGCDRCYFRRPGVDPEIPKYVNLVGVL